MANQPSPQILGQSHLNYVDRVDVAESFAHSLRRLSFDGSNVLMEFVVNRLDDPKVGNPPQGSAVTACRLVLPLPGAMALLGNLSSLAKTLQDQGVIQQHPQPPHTLN